MRIQLKGKGVYITWNWWGLQGGFWGMEKKGGKKGIKIVIVYNSYFSYNRYINRFYKGCCYGYD